MKFYPTSHSLASQCIGFKQHYGIRNYSTTEKVRASAENNLASRDAGD